MSTSKSVARRRPTPRSSSPRRLAPEAHPAEVVLTLEVTYAQVPGELADTFEVRADIDPKFGSLIRATAVLHAVAAMVERLELQNLLPTIYTMGLHSGLAPSERDRL